MNHEEIREFCLGLKGTEESFPFGEDTLVFIVGGKMYLLLSLDENPPAFNVKCDPAKATALREQYSCVQPGYHMNKVHWNTVTSDGTVNRAVIKSWITDSYNLILQSLPVSKKRQITGNHL